jgi:hypothetical protein
MQDTLSPTHARAAFDQLAARIASTPPNRNRAIPMGEAARRGIELANLVAAPELAGPLTHLTAAGLTPNLAADLRLVALALFHRASVREHTAPPPATAARVPVSLWDEVLVVRRDLLDTLGFGLRHDAQVQDTLSRVRAGRGYLDHAQDLATLADLARTHAAALGASLPGHFDPNTPARAAALADAMLEALGVVHEAAADETDWRTWGLFTRLFAEARIALQFLWRDDPARLERIPNLQFRRGQSASSGNATPAAPAPEDAG